MVEYAGVWSSIAEFDSDTQFLTAHLKYRAYEKTDSNVCVDQDVGLSIPQVKTNHLAVYVTPPMSTEVQVYICHTM